MASAFWGLYNKELQAAKNYYVDPVMWCEKQLRYKPVKLAYLASFLPQEQMLPDKIQDALNKLSAECAQHGLKLNSVDIKKVQHKPYVTEYIVHTACGTVKVTQEV